MKTLIAYFSRAGENYVNGSITNISKGNNEVLAEKLKKLLLEADVFKIEPLTPYSESYMTCIEEAKKDLNSNARPKLKQTLDNIDEYDKIFLIYPIYWGTFPMHVFTFLESLDFSGKTIIPISTHEGSGLGSSEKDLKKLLPTSKVLNGTAINGGRVNSADSILEKIIKL